MTRGGVHCPSQKQASHAANVRGQVLTRKTCRCNYSTPDRTQRTRFGERTTDEMCFNFMLVSTQRGREGGEREADWSLRGAGNGSVLCITQALLSFSQSFRSPETNLPNLLHSVSLSGTWIPCRCGALYLCSEFLGRIQCTMKQRIFSTTILCRLRVVTDELSYRWPVTQNLDPFHVKFMILFSPAFFTSHEKRFFPRPPLIFPISATTTLRTTLT